LTKSTQIGTGTIDAFILLLEDKEDGKDDDGDDQDWGEGVPELGYRGWSVSVGALLLLSTRMLARSVECQSWEEMDGVLLVAARVC
jgi:hypothetical protein